MADSICGEPSAVDRPDARLADGRPVTAITAPNTNMPLRILIRVIGWLPVEWLVFEDSLTRFSVAVRIGHKSLMQIQAGHYHVMLLE